LTPVVRKIINKALQFNRLVVYDILLPRNQVRFLDLNDTLEENLALARETGHTRFPLCEDDLDRCLGIIHIKDVFRHPGDPKKLNLLHIKRDISSLRLDLPLEDALQRLLRQRAHMALVQDEFGGTLGLVTLERILEELVGEIQDEFDSEERLIKRKSHNTWQVAGLVPLHDFEEVVQLEMENADVSTFGGLITSELGRFPEPGEKLMLLNRLEVSIDEVEETRIKWASVVKLPEPEPDSESSTKSAEAS
jgi:CBS domain containing-hemolysin-like protein